MVVVIEVAIALVVGKVSHCGIATNVGETRIYNTTGGPAPRGVAELGEEVWRSDRPLPERGFTALGVLRNIPPEDVRPYAEGRDRAACATLQECLGEPTVEGEPLASTAWAVAATPATQGGLGLQSAMRTAPAAYWGAWADTLGYWHARQPRLAAACVQAVERGGAGRPAFSAAHAAANLLRSEGWQECSTWATLLSTPCAALRRLASRLAVPRIAYTLTLLPRSNATALLGAGSPGAVAVPVGSPSRGVAHGHTHGQVHLAATRSHADRASQTSPYAAASGTRPLRPTWARMPKTVRPLGRPCARLHMARRAKLVEQAWLAVCCDTVGAEGHVVPQQRLSHTSAPGVPTSDRRRLDLVVYGASPLGLALCCDATLVSPITGTSTPHPRAEHTPGIALRMAESRKRATYPELQRGGGQRLFDLAVEVGGRWNADSQALVRQLVRVRALRAPPALRAAASTAWTRRWWGMLSTAVQHAVGGTALGAPWLVSKGAAACEPSLDHVLALAEPAGPSRLPLR